MAKRESKAILGENDMRLWRARDASTDEHTGVYRPPATVGREEHRVHDPCSSVSVKDATQQGQCVARVVGKGETPAAVSSDGGEGRPIPLRKAIEAGRELAGERRFDVRRLERVE